jgi:hypothetical protein
VNVQPTVHPSPGGVKSSCARPFSALPHALQDDPRLTPRAVLTAARLLKYARGKAACWPSNRRLAADMRCSARTAQCGLAALRAAGWVACEPCPGNRTGRLIRLLWRAENVTPPRGFLHPPPVKESAPEGENVIVKENKESRAGCGFDPRLRPAPAPAPAPLRDPAPGKEVLPTPAPPPAPAPVPPAAPAVPASPSPVDVLRAAFLRGKEEARKAAEAEALARAAPDPGASLARRIKELEGATDAYRDPAIRAEIDLLNAALRGAAAPPEPPPRSLTTAELLAKLPGRHDLVVPAAGRLCEETGDLKGVTWQFFARAAAVVAARSVGPRVLPDCLAQAKGPKAGHAGKVFVAAWKRAGPSSR